MHSYAIPASLYHCLTTAVSTRSRKVHAQLGSMYLLRDLHELPRAGRPADIP